MPAATAPDWPTARAFVPAGAGIADLAEAARSCRGCPLHALDNTGTVFGEGRLDARLMMIGEQPGDVEDRRGRPFVGPAGKLLDRALHEIGLERDQIYITNAVKHFKFTTAGAGKRRIHAGPDRWEVLACKPWLEAELNRIRPAMVVLLGATAAQALLGPSFRVTRSRGTLLDGPSGSGARLLATIHPSAILRTPDDQRETAYNGFVADLRVAVAALPAV